MVTKNISNQSDCWQPGCAPELEYNDDLSNATASEAPAHMSTKDLIGPIVPSNGCQ